MSAAQAIPQTGHVLGVIDAEIAEKGHLLTETNKQLACRSELVFLEKGDTRVW